MSAKLLIVAFVQLIVATLTAIGVPGKPIAVCDCETDPFKAFRIPRPFVWGYYDGTAFRHFRTTESFVEFLREQRVIVYAHNGGRFDWHYLLPWVDPYDEVMLINGRIAKMRIGAAECRDSWNIVPVPLSAYKKDDIDYSILEEGERDRAGNWQTIMRYLRSDCVYLYELVERFVSEYGMNLTQAGASMKQWRKISSQEGLPSVPETGKEFYDRFSPYYYGGRVQCFASGVLDVDCSCYDINSAYPYAMLQKHPYSGNYSVVEGYAEGADFYRLRATSTGVFPFREGERAGLSFPVDGNVREFSVSGWEFMAAVETKSLLDYEVLESVTFVTHVDFGSYVNHFYQKRQECKYAGDEAGSLFAKLFMNSLYGKFAANPSAYKNYMIVPLEVVPRLDALGWRFAGEFGPWGLAESDLQEERQRWYNVATGASITGFVRAMLWRAIHSSKGVLYCDTDSIICKAPGKGITMGDTLGQWKFEGSFDKAGIAGKKLYIFRGAPDQSGKRTYKSASKGVRLTNAELWRVAKGGSVDYESEAPTFSAFRSLASIVDAPIKRRSDRRNTGKFFTQRRVVNTAKG